MPDDFVTRLHYISVYEEIIMYQRILLLIIAGFILGTSAVMADGSDKIKAAVTSAEKWIRLIDEGQYIESWKESSEYFQQAVKQDQWEQAVRTVRIPLGKMVSRELKSTVYTTSLPGVPDGEYVVIEFNTSFENKESGVEIVTPQMDKDGIWKVSGYYIK